jgi:hypothetical protein
MQQTRPAAGRPAPVLVSASQPERDGHWSLPGAGRIADLVVLAARTQTEPLEGARSVHYGQPMVRSNTSLTVMVELLRLQHTAKRDVVTPAAGLRSTACTWEIGSAGPTILGTDGVTRTPRAF